MFAVSAASAQELSGKIVWVTNRTDIADTLLTDMANDFMALHPGTTVEVEGIKDVEQTMLTRMAANEMPDVSLMITSKLTKSDFANYFLPLDDLGYTADDFYFYDYGVGDDGKLYGITPDMYTNCVFYNRATFEIAGIESVPRTLEELDAVCQKLLEAGIIPMATSFRDSWPLRGWLSGYYTQIGMSGNADFLNELVQSDLLFDDTEFGNLYTLNIARDFALKGYFEPELAAANWDNQRRDVLNNDIAMFYDGAWYGPQLVSTSGLPVEDCGAFPFPGAKVLTVSPNWFYGVAKNTKYPELAKAFLQYMLEDGRYATILEVECTNKDILSDLPGLEELYSFGLPVMEMPNVPAELIDILNKGLISLDSVTQEYLLTSDPQSIIDKYNDKWQQAKEDLGL